LKYFIFSISLTLILLFGIALIYSELGTVDFIELNLIFAHPLESSLIIKIGIYFILFGLLLKLAIFPFHG
jgi:NADH-quinone oxidoreductase subunit N